MIRIDQATPADAAQVLSLVESLLRELEENPEDRGPGAREFEGIDRAKVLKDLSGVRGRFAVFLARTDAGETVGVATVMEAFAIYAGGNYGIIDEMYVVPGRRSAGVGGRIIEAIKAHGRRKGWLRIDVTAPPERHWERTVKFYEKQGFVFTGPKLRLKLK
ncbi:MAG TPA: GNAT family N-acetyltransferase [Candidatus Polarisedimenticolia bacterium]